LSFSKKHVSIPIVQNGGSIVHLYYRMVYLPLNMVATSSNTIVDMGVMASRGDGAPEEVGMGVVVATILVFVTYAQ
jgi:hypothetical protein